MLEPRSNCREVRLELVVDDSRDGIGRARLELVVEKSNYRAVADGTEAFQVLTYM